MPATLRSARARPPRPKGGTQAPRRARGSSLRRRRGPEPRRGSFLRAKTARARGRHRRGQGTGPSRPAPQIRRREDETPCNRAEYPLPARPGARLSAGTVLGEQWRPRSPPPSPSCCPASVTSAWIRGTILSTSGYVTAVTPVAASPAVRAAVQDAVTSQVGTGLSHAETSLPPSARVLPARWAPGWRFAGTGSASSWRASLPALVGRREQARAQPAHQRPQRRQRTAATGGEVVLNPARWSTTCCPSRGS